MDKSEIVKFFIERGAHVDKSALDIIYSNTELLESLKSLDQKELPHFITSDFIAKLQGNPTKLPKNNLTLSTGDYLQNYIKRYDFIKQILVRKQNLSNLVSVSKISPRMKNFSLIGIVTSVDYETLTLEDTTGTTKLTIDNDMCRSLIEDEIIGVVCEKSGNGYKITKTMHPDVPVKRDATKAKSDHICLFLPGIVMESKESNPKFYQNFLEWLEKHPTTILVLGEISSKQADVEKFLKDVSNYKTIVTEHDPFIYQIDNMRMLISSGEFLIQYMKRWSMKNEDTVINLLKKRHLNPANALNDDMFLLNTIPDVLAFGNIGEPSSTNYKGTTITFSGDFTSIPVFWMVDLKTRETFKIDFS